MNIHIDYRETDLYNYLNSINTSNEFNINKINLEIGDIIIESVDIDKNIKLIFERKTINDLLSSIKDGRYKEQKLRMINTLEPHKCCYIIEKNLYNLNKLSEADKNIIDSSLIHIMFRDKIHIIETNNIEETGNWILKIARRCNKNPQNFTNAPMESGDNIKYIDCLKVKTKKSENITKETCYLLQLCQIPGISKTIAKEIAKIYPSFKDFYNSELSLEKLKNIPMIGDKKAKIIFDYIN
jgi:ERCC4-type nuclease